MDEIVDVLRQMLPMRKEAAWGTMTGAVGVVMYQVRF